MLKRMVFALLNRNMHTFKLIFFFRGKETNFYIEKCLEKYGEINYALNFLK